MKAQYVGDIGDFGKLLLLKYLTSFGFKIGVNWVLTDNDKREDGKHRDYVDYRGKDCLCCCDEDLFENILPLVRKDKDCRRIEDLECLARKQCAVVLFYSERFDSGTPRKSSDDAAFAKLSPELAEVVFFDPDNGVDLRASSSVKHVYFPDLKRYWDREQSLLIYHHLGRTGTHEMQIANLKSTLQREFPKSDVYEYRLRRGTARAYFLILQTRHAAKIIGKEAIASIAPLQLSKAEWALKGRRCTKVHAG